MARLHKLDQASGTNQPGNPGEDEPAGDEGGPVTPGGGGGPLTPIEAGPVTPVGGGGGGIPVTPGGPDFEVGGDFEPFDEAHPWTETLDVTTDANGKVKVWVLSSDVICQPRLLAKWKNADGNMVEVGDVTCDFAASVTFRHFANPVDPDDPDDFGWIFDFPSLMNPDGGDDEPRKTPAKVYLKFKIDSTKSDDYTYTDASGVTHGNWQFVNGHELLLRVGSVEVSNADSGEVEETQGTPGELKRYAFVVSSASGPANASEVTVIRTTTAMGETPQVYVFAGEDIDDVATIYVEAEDQTEWEQ